MIYKYSYTNDAEKQTILNVNKDKFLIEEQIITEGNFLLFSDNLKEDKPETYIQMQIDIIKQVIDSIVLGGDI